MRIITIRKTSSSFVRQRSNFCIRRMPTASPIVRWSPIINNTMINSKWPERSWSIWSNISRHNWRFVWISMVIGYWLVKWHSIHSLFPRWSRRNQSSKSKKNNHHHKISRHRNNQPIICGSMSLFVSQQWLLYWCAPLFSFSSVEH